jgi:hypothetical protein
VTLEVGRSRHSLEYVTLEVRRSRLSLERRSPEG